MKNRPFHTAVNRWQAGRIALLVLSLLAVLTACQTPSTPVTVNPSTGADGAQSQASISESTSLTDTEVAAPSPTPTLAPTALPTSEPLSGRVVVWHSWAGLDGDALAASLATLRTAAPGLTVDTLFVAPDDLPQAYADAVAAGGGPDLVLTDSWWLNDLLAAGVVQPLDSLIAPSQIEQFVPAALANFQRDGQTYGLPLDIELVALYVNRSLVADDQMPATTDELLTLAQSAPQQGIGLYASLYHQWWGFPAYGATLFAADGRVILDQGDGAAQFLTWLRRLKSTPGSFVDEDYGMLLDRFKKGEFAFLVDGPWSSTELRQALGDNLGVTTLPAGPSAAALPWLNAEGVYLNPNLTGSQRALALRTALHFASAESSMQYGQIAGRVPANRAVTTSDPILNGFLLQAANAQPAPTQPEMDVVWGYGGDMLLKVLNDVGEASAVVTETAALINDETGQ